MRLFLTSCALVCAAVAASAQSASPAPAPTPASPPPGVQTPAPSADLAAAKARVAAALQKCSALSDTAFALRWGPDKKKKADDPFARMMGEMGAGATKGSWHGDLMHVAFDNDNDDELLIAGGRMLAKDGTVDWRPRRARFADGNTVPFVPDVPALLRQLAAWDLAVTQRTVGSLDDRPVEVISITLSADQVAEAIWAGLLPEAIATSMGAGRVFRMAMGGGGGARPPATPPDATVDLAIHLDPATNVVHKLHFRGWTKEPKGGAAGVIMVAGGARVARNGDDDEEEEDEVEADEAAAKKDAPLVYENGLPVRPRKKTSVCDVALTLTEHGQKPAPALTPEQKQLLGR